MGDFIGILGDELSRSFIGSDWKVALVRLGLACLFGAIVGFERELEGKSAGMRTHILVAVAACLFTLVALQIVAASQGSGADEALRLDPLRLIEGVTAGVAFLGAGTIIVARKKVRGLTTAAGMWLAGAIGLATGVGEGGLAAMVTALAVFILWPLKMLESSRGDE